MKKLFILALGCATFISCKKVETPIVKDPLVATTKSDINATYSNYQYFSFALGDTVPFSDSTSTKWDIAFKGTTVILNSGVSGSGVAGVIILDTLFSEVITAPSVGYAQDNASSKAIPTGSNNGWYNYAGPPSHAISPLAGKVFVIKTATGNFAKLEFISYYLGAPATPDGLLDISKYFKIRYVYQPDGTTNLK